MIYGQSCVSMDTPSGITPRNQTATCSIGVKGGFQVRIKRQGQAQRWGQRYSCAQCDIGDGARAELRVNVRDGAKAELRVRVRKLYVIVQ